MRNILIFLLFSTGLQAQKEVRDTAFIRNDSLFIGKVQIFYEALIDTAELHSRYMQINDIIATYVAEQHAIKEKIQFYEDNYSALSIMRQKASQKTKKQPARKPKKSKQ
jgi:uncharacterized protein YktA (UPF0223 family)